MLTPIKKQGDEHVYILLQISIIDWISVRYVDILRFVRMLIGSEITYRDALSILYEVHVKGNHADGDKVLLKKSCHVITPAVAKASFAQALRNSLRAIPLSGHCQKEQQGIMRCRAGSGYLRQQIRGGRKGRTECQGLGQSPNEGHRVRGYPAHHHEPITVKS